MLKEVFLLALAALCVSNAVHINRRTADMEFLHKQKKIYDLVYLIKQNTLTDAEFYEIGRNYDMESNMDMYQDKMVVQEFLYWYRQGMLDRDAIFSPYYEEHREEMRILYKLFVDAKDFQTFYKTAAWARLHINPGVFTSALTVAVFYRPDCKYMKLPAPYEINPHLYFGSDVIQEAQRIKMTYESSNTGLENVDTYMIYANYTGEYVDVYDDDDYKLDYFMEDIDLNGVYYYMRQVMPFWLSNKDIDIPKEASNYYYWFHQQLMARYYLERISNDLGEIEDFDWNKRFSPGYYSTLMYSNGIAVPQRARYANTPYYKYKYLKEIEILEMRIMNAIDLGYVYDSNGKQINIYTPEGMTVLSNLIEGNVDSCNRRFYGMYDALARDILGHNFDYKDKNKMIPSALQCYGTSMRDPAFYRLYKRILTYFHRYKKNMPYYTKNELTFSGVKIESVATDKLTTYFDDCDTFINNAVFMQSFKEGMTLRLKARRECLNYKPFTYRFHINSDKDTKAVVHIFLGPAHDDKQGDMSYLRDYYKYFLEMDKFVVTLKSGTNTLERRSTDSVFTMSEFMSSDMFYKKLQKAIGGSEPFTYNERMFAYPNRLMLPKGKPEGMRYKLFVYVDQFDESKVVDIEMPVFGELMYYGKPLGYPLDRPMYPWKFFTPNMFFKDVYVYHTTENEKTMEF